MGSGNQMAGLQLCAVMYSPFCVQPTLQPYILHLRVKLDCDSDTLETVNIHDALGIRMVLAKQQNLALVFNCVVKTVVT
jgi:hypothetical protein